MFVAVECNNLLLLQSENRLDVEAEPEVHVEAGVRQLFVVVRGQTADLIVQPRENKMAAFNGRQAEENGITGRNFKMLDDRL